MAEFDMLSSSEREEAFVLREILTNVTNTDFYRWTIPDPIAFDMCGDLVRRYSNLRMKQIVGDEIKMVEIKMVGQIGGILGEGK